MYRLCKKMQEEEEEEEEEEVFIASFLAAIEICSQKVVNLIS